MFTRTVLGFIFMMFILVQAGNAGDIQNYFNDTASKVKATTDPAQKRAILDKSLQTMSTALDRVEHSGLISQDDRAGINRLKADLQEKQDELTGSNGYAGVADAQLNAFSDYVVQSMEQADQYITISVVTLLLIIIILILIL
jgi:septal ring factor EnvC (AmiA/AmiB activator)